MHDKAKSLYFNLYKAWILVNSASPTGVEYDAIDEDNALSHLGKIWYIQWMSSIVAHKVVYDKKFEAKLPIHFWDTSHKS